MSLLGAPRREIVATIARRAVLQLVIGVLIGVAGSLWMFHELANDTLVAPDVGLPTLLTIALGTLLVGVLACFQPTWRGLRIEPTEALREY